MEVHFEYVAWFRDSSVDPADEDCEWPAVFLVIARDADHAREWGDVLALGYCSRRPENQFLRSEVQPKDARAEVLPTVRYGDIVSDEVLGW